jgi:hypothetical protein
VERARYGLSQRGLGGLIPRQRMAAADRAILSNLVASYPQATILKEIERLTAAVPKKKPAGRRPIHLIQNPMHYLCGFSLR